VAGAAIVITNGLGGIGVHILLLPGLGARDHIVLAPHLRALFRALLRALRDLGVELEYTSIGEGEELRCRGEWLLEIERVGAVLLSRTEEGGEVEVVGMTGERRSLCFLGFESENL
jgi:hypothetical protein